MTGKTNFQLKKVLEVENLTVSSISFGGRRSSGCVFSLHKGQILGWAPVARDEQKLLKLVVPERPSLPAVWL